MVFIPTTRATSMQNQSLGFEPLLSSTILNNSYAYEGQNEDTTLYYNRSDLPYDYNDTVDANASSGTLTPGQEKALALCAVVAGALSVVGSALIISMVLGSAKITPYKRILLGLSIFDIITSITYAVQPFLLPQDSSPRAWAFGNDATCSTLGFFYQLSFAAVWYNSFLSYYYLFTVRYSVSPTDFARKYEPWGHGLCIGYNLIAATVGAAIGIYSELMNSQGCWVMEYPEGCLADDTVTCIHIPVAWVYGGAPFLFHSLSVAINNILIYRFVKKTTQKMNRYGVAGSTASTSGRDKRVQAVATQALLYVGTFFLSYIWTLFLRVGSSVGLNDTSKLFPLLVLQAIFQPLQGCFNCFVYSRPNYLRNRRDFPNHSRWWALQKVWADQSMSSDSRRRSSNFGSSRRSSLFRSGWLGGGKTFRVAEQHQSATSGNLTACNNEKYNYADAQPIGFGTARTAKPMTGDESDPELSRDSSFHDEVEIKEEKKESEEQDIAEEQIPKSCNPLEVKEH